MNRKQKETAERMYEARGSEGSLDAFFGGAGPAVLAELAEKVRARDLGGKDWSLGNEVQAWLMEEFPYEAARYAAGQGAARTIPNWQGNVPPCTCLNIMRRSWRKSSGG